MSNARNSKDAKRLTKLYGTRERGVGHQRVLLLIRERGLDGAIAELEAMGFRPLIDLSPEQVETLKQAEVLATPRRAEVERDDGLRPSRL